VGGVRNANDQAANGIKPQPNNQNTADQEPNQYASTDLIHWTHHSNAISRPTQLSVLRSSADLIEARNPDSPNTKLCFQGGLYAPTLRHHSPSGTFYLLCTNIVREASAPNGTLSQNFWVTTKDIEAGEWSDPTYFEFEGIDPSIWFEEDGARTRAYVVGSRGPGPGTKINLFEVDLETGKKLSEEKTLWTGELQFYPEGPHLYRRSGWYWLLIAEGGTHEGHVINVARSKELWGPYESCPDNPIVKRCHYGDDVQCTGHMDLIEGDDAQWWGVCLGIRRRGDKGVRMVHGRETFLTKITWPSDEQGWLSADKVMLAIEGLERKGNHVPAAGSDGIDLVWIREPRLEDYAITNTKSGVNVILRSSEGDLDQVEAPVSFVGKRQRLMEAQAQVKLTLKDLEKPLRVGLAVYKDEHRFLRISVDVDGASQRSIGWQLLNKAKDIKMDAAKTTDVQGEEVWLRISYTGELYSLAFKTADGNWATVSETPTDCLSGADFVGPIIGVFATTGEAGQAVTFENFLVDQE
jgi:beta-xylosidase